MAVMFLFLLAAIHSVAFGLSLPFGQRQDEIQTHIAIRHSEAKTVTAQKNGQLLLNCSVAYDKSLSDLSFTWNKDGQNVITDTRDQRIGLLNNGSLFFQRVIHKPRKNKTDAGQYDCVVSVNNVGKIIARRVAVLVAGIDREFVLEPQPQSVPVGGVARFSCQINAVPAPFYIWERNRTALPQDDDRLTILSSGILQITKIQEADAGQYRCRATQGSLHELPDVIDKIYEKFSSEAKLAVYRGASSRPAKIVANSKNVVSIVGQPVTLECFVDGDYTSVVWRRQGSSGPVELDGRRTLVGNNLKFREVMEEDGGNYLCEVVSSNQPTVQASCKLSVYKPPVIHQGPKNSRNQWSEWDYLDCVADGSPKPTVSWYKDGRLVDYNNPRFSARNNNKLAIVQGEAEDSGFYQCFAQNAVGYSMAFAKVEFIRKENSPGKPENVTIVTVTKDMIELRWSPAKSPLNHPTVAYNVDYSRASEKNDMVTPHPHAILSPLKPFTNYSIFVTPFSNSGAGLKSNVCIVQTLEDVPARPVSVSLEPRRNSILVTWQELPMAYRNGRIVGYKINYRQAQSEKINILDNVKSTETSYLITGLEPSTEYEVRMTAATSVGFTFPDDTTPGDRWAWVSARTALGEWTLPLEIQVVPINATSVNVTWYHGMDQLLKGFTLLIRNLKHGSNTTVIDLPAATKHYALNDLDEHSTYEVTLVVENRDGSDSTISKEFRTDDVPLLSMPKNLRATLVKATMIDLHWYQPDTDIVITHYTVRYSEWRQGNAVGELKYRSCYTTSVLLEDLKASTEYQIAVRANSEHSSGPFSMPLIQQTLQAVPFLPRDLKVELGKDGSATVSWLAPETTSEPVTSYVLLYSTDLSSSDTAWQQITQSGDVFSLTVTGLEKPTYYFKLQSVTAAGASDFTEPVTLELSPLPGENRDGPSVKDQRLGIIIGISIGAFCVIVCIVVICLRIRYFSNPYNQQPETQPARIHGNGHIPGHGNGNGHAVAIENRNSAVQYEMDPYTPMLSQLPENEQSDSKGGGNGNVILTPNGAKLNGFVPLKKNGVKNGQVPNGHMTEYIASHYKDQILDAEERKGLIAAMLGSSEAGGQCIDGHVPEDSYTRSRFDGSLDDIDRSMEDMSGTPRELGTTGAGSSVEADELSASDGNSDSVDMCRYSGGSVPRSDTTDTGDTVVLQSGFGRRDLGGGGLDRPPSSVSDSGCGDCNRSTSSGALCQDGEAVKLEEDIEETSLVLPQIQPTTTSILVHSQALRTNLDTTGEGEGERASAGLHGGDGLRAAPASQGGRGQREVTSSPTQGYPSLDTSLPQLPRPLVSSPPSATRPGEEVTFSPLPQDRSRSLPRRRQDYV